MGQSGGLADDPIRAPGPPQPPTTERSWQGLAVGLSIAIAIVLLLVAVAVIITRGDDDPEATSPTTSAATSTTTSAQADPAATGATSVATGPPTTRKATPRSIVAADDRRVVVLDQSGAAAPRTLFDLGPSDTSDTNPPFIGGVALSGDGESVFFDVAGTPPTGSIRRVPVTGGQVQELGEGVAPVPSPDGSLLALLKSPEPDVPAIVLVRPLGGGAERRFELGEGSCGNVAWAPSGRELAVDLCTQQEPLTVALIDVASGGIRTLSPPDGLTWSVPAFKADGTLTLVEQREADAAVVALTPDRNRVASTILRRPSTTITTIDWSASGDLVVCDADAIVLAAVGGGTPEQVATGFSAAAW